LQNAEPECIKRGEGYFRIYGLFKNDLDSEFKINLDFSSGETGKTFTLNTEKVNKLNEILGLLPLVTLSPYDLKLTTGVPHERRRNFDLLISQTSRIYLEDIRNLSRILRQKNTLLKDNLMTKRYSYNDLKQMIKVWNEELINVSVKIIVRRMDFMDNFKPLLAESFRELVDSNYEPIVEIESDLLNTNNNDIDLDTLSNSFRTCIDEKLDQEIKRGISLFGPQRDNYVFTMKKNGDIFDVRSFASQGEHKLFLIALKLAEFKYISRFIEGSFKGLPIFILDDLFSELDEEKVNRLCELLPRYNQLFITTTDYKYLGKLTKYFPGIESKAFEIVNGKVIHVN
jgi:DNA replication and repair protein RecF